MNINLQDLDTIINWESYSFDGINLPSTGILCKWGDGTIDYFDPREHLGTVDYIQFIESDEPQQEVQDDDSIVEDDDDECIIIMILAI